MGYLTKNAFNMPKWLGGKGKAPSTPPPAAVDPLEELGKAFDTEHQRHLRHSEDYAKQTEGLREKMKVWEGTDHPMSKQEIAAIKSKLAELDRAHLASYESVKKAKHAVEGHVLNANNLDNIGHVNRVREAFDTLEAPSSAAKPGFASKFLNKVPGGKFVMKHKLPIALVGAGLGTYALMGKKKPAQDQGVQEPGQAGW